MSFQDDDPDEDDHDDDTYDHLQTAEECSLCGAADFQAQHIAGEWYCHFCLDS